MSENLIVTNAQNQQNTSQNTTVVPKRYRLIFNINQEEYHLSRDSNNNLYCSTDEEDKIFNRTPISTLAEIDLLTSTSVNREDIIRRFDNLSNSCELMIREVSTNQRFEMIWNSHEVAEHTQKIASHSEEVEGIDYEGFRQKVIENGRERRSIDCCVLERAAITDGEKKLYYLDEDSPSWVQENPGFGLSISSIDKITLQFTNSPQFSNSGILVDDGSEIISSSSCYRIIRADRECFYPIFAAQDSYGLKDAISNIDNYGVTRIQDEDGNIKLIPYIDFRKQIQEQIEERINNTHSPNKTTTQEERELSPEEKLRKQKIDIFGKGHPPASNKNWG